VLGGEELDEIVAFEKGKNTPYVEKMCVRPPPMNLSPDIGERAVKKGSREGHHCRSEEPRKLDAKPLQFAGIPRSTGGVSRRKREPSA